ncbi:basic amino acid ABC transporter substrate-binding protein [Bacillus sp. AGMB 02131]|uniref:Basic amino acid ABC transporter substrate-binding protein n=1 Tax=Peribacillus faecalis TaxID=2772559 RepID=A0A927CXC1_9BACI|nr:basic amino acid ABC transporter substrate-binding protein [Peribacillus faecalis]MBD3108791.1 basic amino acid ABC transporter substrate-binding protein [Peribacillus faecalis]
MKKWMLSLTLLCAFLAILAGCGSSDDSSGEGEEKKTLKVLTNAAYAPMEYMDKDDVVGFDVDFIKAVAKEAGYELKIQHIGWDPLFVEMESKRADMAISSITINDERRQKFDFSVPYYRSTNKILVPENSTVASSEDLKDKVIAVQQGTTGDFIATELLGKTSTNVKRFEENTLAIMELVQNGADAVIADQPVLEAYAKSNPDEELKVITDDSFENEYYGVMFAKGNTDLQKEINEAINTLFENGTYEKIYEEWFGEKPDTEDLKAQQ